MKRIKPLYETPEKDIIAYCAYKNLNHYSQECCPYSWSAKRNEYREMLNNFENRFPGTMYSILRFDEELLPFVAPKENEKPKMKLALKKCKKCGEPTEKELCKACEMIKILKIQKNSKGIKSSENKVSKADKSKTCAQTKGYYGSA